MLKQKVFLGLTLALVGCTNRDRAQQFLDGDLTAPLGQTTTHIESASPHNFTGFAEQTSLVENGSPSLSTAYKPLYDKLKAWVLESGDPSQLGQYAVTGQQLAGADRKGNVLFTGYFSPVIELSHHKTETFPYAVYGNPKCGNSCPTRAQIYAGALDHKNLELGYAKNRIDPFIMEVQGSGFVHFNDDNTLQYFAYSGKNNHPYVSIGGVLVKRNEIPKNQISLKSIKQWVHSHSNQEVRALLEQNQSFVFFKPSKTDVTGTAGIPLVPMASVAGDRNLLPMGTPILAEVPLLNPKGQWTGVHVLRLLIVLDTGGAVTNHHLDLYHGMGKRAGIEAGHYRHFGRVWKLSLIPPAPPESVSAYPSR